ncbi:MAG: ABC transporter permease [Planctomycetes bacterium]|nr:ABC transporter permease [Planctomycetota bacterium]
MARANAFAAVGRWVVEAALLSGYVVVLVLDSAYWLRSLWTKRREVVAQMYSAGVESFGVTMVVAFFAGMIVALSAGIELANFGQQNAVGALVAVSMCREMGPFMCGLTLAACVGSAMAAELGTMKVSEEIDALEVMSIDPVRMLVMPRIVALTIMCPILTVFSDLVGTLGGAVVAFYRLDVDYNIYFQFSRDFLNNKAIWTGLAKATVFGAAIASISCAQGLRTERGALGVGQATRSSVLISFIMIIVLGYYMTALFYGDL